MLDQLRADALSCYGNGVVDTPNIDRLAQKGVMTSRVMLASISTPNAIAHTSRTWSMHASIEIVAVFSNSRKW